MGEMIWREVRKEVKKCGDWRGGKKTLRILDLEEEVSTAAVTLRSHVISRFSWCGDRILFLYDVLSLLWSYVCISNLFISLFHQSSEIELHIYIITSWSQSLSSPLIRTLKLWLGWVVGGTGHQESQGNGHVKKKKVSVVCFLWLYLTLHCLHIQYEMCILHKYWPTSSTEHDPPGIEELPRRGKCGIGKVGDTKM